jgi:hypothetical protein
LSAVVKITLRTTMAYLIVGGFTPLALRSHALTGRGWVDGLPVLDLGAAEDDSPVKWRYWGDWQGCAARQLAGKLAAHAGTAAGYHRELAGERVHSHDDYLLCHCSSTLQGACSSMTRRAA